MATESRVFLGDLLVQFGIIAETDVDDATKLAAYTGLPLGKCLILLDCISESVLKAALEAQVLLQEGTAEFNVLGAAMQIVRRQEWQLSDALISLGRDAHATSRTRLGELLSDASIINQVQLSFALQAADFSCLPLGRVLTSFDAVSAEAIDEALNLQRSIRRGSIERLIALDLIRTLFASSSGRNIESVHFRLGDLLIKTGLLTNVEIEQAIVVSSETGKLTGQYLVERRLIGEEVLMTVLCMQNLLDAQLISFEPACEVISNVARFNQSFGSDRAGTSLYHFLRASGYLNDHRLMVIAKPHMQIAASKLSDQLSEQIEEQSEELDDMSGSGSITVQTTSPNSLESIAALKHFANHAVNDRINQSPPQVANQVANQATNQVADANQFASLLNSGEPKRTQESVQSILHDQTFLRAELVKAFPAEIPIVNSGVILHELVKTQRLTLNQALVIFAFTQKNLRMSVA